MRYYADETPEPVVARPAATVIPIRERDNGFQVLLIHRNPELSFQGDMWAFPGGRIESGDYLDDKSDEIAAARIAAVREATEETGIHISPDGLVMLSRWTTPEFQPKRYKTWFFVAAVDDQRVQVDGGETLHYSWMTPSQALNAQKNGEIHMMPPTFVSLEILSQYASVKEALAGLKDQTPEYFLPRVRTVTGGFISLYHGDVAYEGGDMNQPGRRHRFWGLDSGWWYERNDWKEAD